MGVFEGFGGGNLAQNILGFTLVSKIRGAWILISRNFCIFGVLKRTKDRNENPCIVFVIHIYNLLGVLYIIEQKNYTLCHPQTHARAIF